MHDEELRRLITSRINSVQLDLAVALEGLDPKAPGCSQDALKRTAAALAATEAELESLKEVIVKILAEPQ